MGAVVGDLLPSAVGIALSPFPIVAIVLVLGTPRARTNGPAFALGWLAGLTAVAALAVVFLSGADDPDGETSTLAYLAKVALGVLFLVLAVKQWRSRPAPGEEAELPAWMTRLDSLTAGRALVLGVALSAANPKNLALTLAAGASIAQSGLNGLDETIVAAVFVALGSIVVVGAVLFSLVAPGPAGSVLESVKDFMIRNNAVIMMVVLLVLGAKLLGEGIGGL